MRVTMTLEEVEEAIRDQLTEVRGIVAAPGETIEINFDAGPGEFVEVCFEKREEPE